MAFVFALGVVSGIAAALLRRYRRASSMALAGGAGLLLVLSAAGLVPTDAREGLAAIEANRRQYLFVIPLRACVRTASAGAGTRFPGATQETLLAWLGNPRCVHLVRGSCRHLARVFLALVNRADTKQRSGQGSPDKKPESPERTRPLRQYS